jgi:hypothetical protein
MKIPITPALSLAVLAGISLVTPAMAASYIGDYDGNSVTATAQYNSSSAWAPASRLVDGFGMINLTVGKVTKSSQIDPYANYTSTWAEPSSTSIPGYLLFTFDKNTSLNEMVIWNNAFDTSRDMKAVMITYSLGANTSGTGGGTLFSGNLTRATGYGYTDDFIFNEVQNVKAVKIAYTSNYGGDYVILSEVRFAGTPTAIPEPSSLVALSSLVVTAAFIRARRKR